MVYWEGGGWKDCGFERAVIWVSVPEEATLMIEIESVTAFWNFIGASYKSTTV